MQETVIADSDEGCLANDECMLALAAVTKFGWRLQTVKAVEELSELSAALLKYLDGRNSEQEVCREIADVNQMMIQMSLIFGECTLERQEKALKLQKILTQQPSISCPRSPFGLKSVTETAEETIWDKEPAVKTIFEHAKEIEDERSTSDVPTTC